MNFMDSGILQLCLISPYGQKLISVKVVTYSVQGTVIIFSVNILFYVCILSVL